MSFETVQPGSKSMPEGLRSGQCTIDKSGSLLVLLEDLPLVDIDTRAVVLADADNQRLAIRAPREGENALAVQVRPVYARRNKRESGRRRITIGHALRAMGLTPAQVAGRYELSTHDDLLIVHLVIKVGADGDEN